MEMQPKLLVAKDIWKQYGTLSVLKGVSLELSKGELVSIVGPSGAGKSTLLYIVSSLEKADKGQVFFDGVAIDQLNNQQLAHLEIHVLVLCFSSTTYYPNSLQSKIFQFQDGLENRIKKMWQKKPLNY